ncbi:hypothetical protein, partial [Bartonella florencae]|uniref:hypothetical protein n=1 Tax=Bartonella florencae TaxID=928210 RepID=UPI001AEC502D
LGRGDWPIDAEYAPPVIDMERFAALTNPAPELVGSAVVALAPGPDHRHGKTRRARTGAAGRSSQRSTPPTRVCTAKSVRSPR